jgi:hypothetical protein
VAFHELARLHRASARPDQARRVVEQGLARFPADEKLLLLATWDAQQTGHADQAAGYLARVLPAAEGEAGPRLRYGGFPKELLTRIESDLAAAVLAGRTRLGAALAAGEGKTRKRP